MSVALHHEDSVPSTPSTGPPLVLVHSIGTSLAVWEPAARGMVGAGTRTIACDLRGHGGSPVGTPSTPERPWSLADLGGDVLGLLDELRVERAAIAGVSLGGMVALWLGAHAPDRVTHVAACCTGARLAPASLWRERAELVRARGTAAIADAVVARWFARGFVEGRPEAVAAVRAVLESTPAEGYAGAADAIADADLRPDLARIAAPTLVLAGAGDVATPPAEHAEPLVAAIAGAELHVLDDAAHLAPLERPRETVRLLRALLARRA